MSDKKMCPFCFVLHDTSEMYGQTFILCPEVEEDKIIFAAPPKLNQRIYGDGGSIDELSPLPFMTYDQILSRTWPPTPQLESNLVGMIVEQVKAETASWTCSNHLTPVADIPVGEKCPICR
jgi:hypothetical protein